MATPDPGNSMLKLARSPATGPSTELAHAAQQRIRPARGGGPRHAGRCRLLLGKVLSPT
jgi:hypothetical protein